jgi:hypothetical protein
MKHIIGHLFDGWASIRYALSEAGKQLNNAVDDALDVWGDDG